MKTTLLAIATLIGFLAMSLTATTVNSQEITITVKPKPPVKQTDDGPFKGKRPSVDVAILLDTSNSMDGLSSQAKSQIWRIIQEFAAAEKAGKTPSLRVSVFEYGNSGLPAQEGYIRQVVQLTDNLDKVSEALFSLKTNGGDEYCGMVIDEALTRLDWSNEPNSFKAIFIAGNEPFTQGSVDYQKSCRRAIEMGVVVNTIHCGDYQAGISGKWQHGAQLAEGDYMNINQDRKVVHIETPQDKIIIKLNTELNSTYLWYGDKATRTYNSSNQLVQDSNAVAGGGRAGFSSRILSKSGKMYRNDGRDLVDSLKEDKKILGKIKSAQLPEAMQKMSPAERETHVKKMAAKRAEIQKKIADLSKKRQSFIDDAKKKNAEEDAEDTLGDAVSNAVRKQLKKSGFEFKKKK